MWSPPPAGRDTPRKPTPSWLPCSACPGQDPLARRCLLQALPVLVSLAGRYPSAGETPDERLQVLALALERIRDVADTGERWPAASVAGFVRDRLRRAEAAARRAECVPFDEARHLAGPSSGASERLASLIIDGLRRGVLRQGEAAIPLHDPGGRRSVSGAGGRPGSRPGAGADATAAGRTTARPRRTRRVLNVAVIRSVDYYLGEVARTRTDYYLGRGESPGRWLGSLSASFGLSGTVDGADLRNILEGRHPATGSPILFGRRVGECTKVRRGHTGFLDAAAAVDALGVSTRTARRWTAAGEEVWRAVQAGTPDQQLRTPAHGG
jgi:hypothetical protein